MKSYTFLIAIFIFTSCGISLKIKKGNGDIISEEIKVDDFSQINAGGNYKINLIKAERPGVVVEMDENLFEYLEIKVHGDELSIHSDYNLKPTESIEIDIFYVDLVKINSSGASALTHRDVLKSDVPDISLSGAGAIDLNLDVDELDINLSGAGAVNLKGYVYSQVVNLSGAGSLEAKDLESRYAEIMISGIGNAKVNVRKELNATISGMGNIEYFGYPDEINQHISGLGKVRNGESGRENENI